MTECRLLEENHRAHFMTRRFDRQDGDRLHMQTLCAMAHLDFKQVATHDYSQFFQTIKSLGLPESDLIEGFRRMVFNVLAANCDDHTKNFSFVMDRDGSWRLSPAYDVTHAYNPEGMWTYQHLMSVNGKFKNISWSDMEQAGERFGIPSKREVYGQVAAALARWPEFAEVAGLPQQHAAQIQKDFIQLL
jgi:serine/threonine-protein kinase HipA